MYKPLLGHRSSGKFLRIFQHSFVLLMVSAETRNGSYTTTLVASSKKNEMKYNSIIKIFIILFGNVLCAQNTISENVSTTETKIKTKYGYLNVKKSISGDNRFLTISSSFYADVDNCSLIDYKVYVTFNIESDCSISSFEITSGKIKCLDDAVGEFCKEIIAKTKEKNKKGLFSIDLSKCGGKYRFPIRILTN